MNKNLNIKEVYYLLLEYFGEKIQLQSVSDEKQELEGILYQSFVIHCDIEERYKRFGCVLVLPGLSNQACLINSLFSEKFAINNDRENILESFKLVDKYCRLRLPDKFLEAFEKAHKSD